MFSRFGSVKELQEALMQTKFKAVGIPYSWTFGGKIKVNPKSPSQLIIEDKKYDIIVRLECIQLVIIAIPGA